MKKNDEKVLKLKEQIAKKKESMENVKFKPITNCNLILDEQRYNLHTLNLDSGMSLLVKVNVLYMSAKDLGKEKMYNISGYNIAEWIEDLKSKVSVLRVKEEEKQLKLLESKLEKMLSEEKKTELELENIEELLKN